MDWLFRQQLSQAAAQQRAMRLAQLKAHQEAEARAASIAHCYPEQRPTNPWQSTANADETLPIPPEVWSQLESERGYLGSWLPTQYPAAQLAWWRHQWMSSSSVGRAVQQREQEAAERAQQQREAEEEQVRQQRADERTQQILQERFRLPDGTTVRIKAPRSRHDHAIGTVVAMEMVGNELWATVRVDPCPPGHWVRGLPESRRPLELLPERLRFKAEMLRREHPEMG